MTPVSLALSQNLFWCSSVVSCKWHFLCTTVSRLSTPWFSIVVSSRQLLKTARRVGRSAARLSTC